MRLVGEDVSADSLMPSQIKFQTSILVGLYYSYGRSHIQTYNKFHLLNQSI